MSETTDVVVASLALAAERAGDIAPSVYERFFASDRAAADLMAHADEHMRGRMFQAVIDFLLTEPDEDDSYLAWEIENHRDAYSTTAPMYVAFFASLMDVVRETVGESWDSSTESAWRERIGWIVTLAETLGPET